MRHIFCYYKPEKALAFATQLVEFMRSKIQLEKGNIMKKFRWNFALALLIAVFPFMGCGVFSNSTLLSTCGLANSLYETNKEQPLNDTVIGSTDLAQSFSTGSAMSVSYADLILLRVNVPNNSANTIRVTIEGDAGNAPNNIPLATGISGVSAVSNSAPTALRFSFGGPTALNANTKYWVRLHTDLPAAGGAGAAQVKWSGSSNSPYPGGQGMYQKINAAWDYANLPGAANYDFVFNLNCK